MTSAETNFNTPMISIDPVVLDRRRMLAYIFLLALGVRLIHLLFLSHAPFFEYKIGDAAKYDLWARHIAAGNWFGDQVFYQAPLYPYFLAAIYGTMGESVMAVRLVQALIGAFSCSILAAAVWNLFDRRAAMVAGVMISLYAPSIFLESLIQKSILDLFFMCLILWLFSRMTTRQDWRPWLMLGASVGGLCLTRENAIAFIPLLAAWCITGPRKFSPPPADPRVPLNHRLAHVAVFATGLALILGPVALRNYAIGGELQITTSQFGPNFYIGNNPAADGYYHPMKTGRGDAKFEQADAVAIAESESNRELTPGEVSNYYLNKSLSFISRQPLDWFRLLGKKALLSLNATEIIDTEDQYVIQQYSPILRLAGLVFNFGLLFPIGIIGMWQSRTRWRIVWPIYLMFLLLQATLIGFFIFGRYRFPIVPILIVFAAPTAACYIDSVLSRIRATKCALPSLMASWRQACAFLALLLVCHLPMVARNVAASTTYNNFAVQAMLRGDHRLAESFISKSIQQNPQFPLAYNSLGVLHREKGEFAQAESSFRKAIELSPNYANAKKNLENLLSLAASSNQ